MNAPSHREWLRRLGLPSLLLIVIVFAWSTVVGVTLYRLLGVTITTVNGRPATFTDELQLHGVDSAIGVTLLQCLLLLILLITRVTYRWWIAVALLIVVGTVVDLISGWRMARYLWGVNRGGTAWESFVPQLLGLAAAWLAYVPVAMLLSRYRVLVVRRTDTCKSPCPRCGYDLYESTGSCPECGWMVPRALLRSDSSDHAPMTSIAPVSRNQIMPDALDTLILDLLEYLATRPRTRAEAMDAWRTSCPRLPVWEEANERGFVAQQRDATDTTMVSLTPAGRAYLDQHPRG